MAPASDLTAGRICVDLLQGAEQWTISLLFEEVDLGTVAARSAFCEGPISRCGCPKRIVPRTST